MKKPTPSLFVLLLALLSGCDTSPPRKNTTVKSGPPNTRFTATDYGTIALDSARYETDRAIVVLKDNETGAEYLLVQGMGATQMMRTTVNKRTVTKEVP